MIGDGWDDDPAIRPGERPGRESDAHAPKLIAGVTGSRAEFGLLRPVFRAIQDREDLELAVIAAGSHLIPPALTFRDVKAAFHVADSVPMQKPGPASRLDDAESTGRGIARITRSYAAIRPDWVLVLGDRIEAFAAAAAASIGGIHVAHIHGGDRAEGVADEAMRHAITKLAHLHFPATPASAERIQRMGEDPSAIHVVGSPAIDELTGIDPMTDEDVSQFGDPQCVFLMHPIGRPDEAEEHAASEALAVIGSRRVLALYPNHDPGRRGILRAIEAADVTKVEHLPRDRFVALLRRLAASGGVLVGNSSAGLIEAAALGVRVVDIGPRQAGRERCANVVSAVAEQRTAIAIAIKHAESLDLSTLAHPYGDGKSGIRIARLLAELPAPSLRKHCAY